MDPMDGTTDTADAALGPNGVTWVSVPRLLLQAIFDVAISSMDFGSGYLDNDDVEALRAIAVLLGRDPAVATPNNFKAQYLIPLDRRESDELSRLRAMKRMRTGTYSENRLMALERRAAANAQLPEGRRDD